MGCKQTKDKKEEGAAAEGQEEAKAEGVENAASEEAKLVAVFGATGAQGGSVVKALLKDSDFKVRAITRDPDSEKSKALAEQGAEVVKGDLNDAESLKAALEGAKYAFLVTNYFEGMDAEKETNQPPEHVTRSESKEDIISTWQGGLLSLRARNDLKQGKAAVDACKEAGVEHLIYSGLENVKEAIGKACHHFDAKAAVEEYIAEKEVPHTCIRCAFYCENLLSVMKPTKNEEGEFVLGIPMGDVALDMIVISELGECVRSILKAGEEYKGKKIGLSSDKLMIDEYAAILNKVCEDKKFVAAKMNTEAFAQLGFPGAEEMAVMFEYYQTGSPDRDAELTKKLHPEMPNFEKWAEANKEAIQALE